MYYNIKSDINMGTYAYFNLSNYGIAILDAILNNSTRSMMPYGHHLDSDSTLLPLTKSAITWFGGGTFGKVLLTGLLDYRPTLRRPADIDALRLLNSTANNGDNWIGMRSGRVDRITKES